MAVVSFTGRTPHVDTDKCQACGNVTYVLASDNSAGEYDPNTFCLDCIVKAFEKQCGSAIYYNGFQKD